MPGKADQFLLRYQRLLEKRGNFPDAWQDISDFVMPLKSDITTTRERGSQRTDRVLDSTAIHARTLLAASMNGAICAPGTQWHTLKLRDERVNQIAEVQRWLEECTKRMHLARRQSNWATEIGEWFNDYCGFHTACIYVSERTERLGSLDSQFGDRFNGLHYRTVPIAEYAIDENADGQVDVLFRCFKLAAYALVQMFTEKGAGADLVEKARKTPEAEIEVVHGVYPRLGHESGRPGARNMRFESCYVAKESKRVLAEGGYEEFPYAVARWEKGSDGIWGVGPSFVALPEIRTLNRARELILRSASKAIDPPLKTMNDGSVGDVDTSAGGRIEVENMDAVQPLDSGGKFDVSQLILNDSRQLIRDVFFYAQLQLQEGAQMTATEIIRRIEMMQRMLGPTFGRVENEGLNQIVGREFNIMFRKKAFPPVPEVLAGQDIDIEYEGPLARAQKAQTLQSFAEWMGLVAPMMQFRPDVLDVLDFDAAALELAEIAGLPSKFRRSSEAIQEIRAQRQQAEQAAQKNALIGQMAESAGKAAPALRELRSLRGGMPDQQATESVPAA